MLTTKLKIKVVPSASRLGISGWLGERLKIRVSQPPEKDKANAAVETVICTELKLPNGSVKIVSGARSQQKMVEVYGLSHAEILQRLESF